jgi:hypothetical protein
MRPHASDIWYGRGSPLFASSGAGYLANVPQSIKLLRKAVKSSSAFAAMPALSTQVLATETLPGFRLANKKNIGLSSFVAGGIPDLDSWHLGYRCKRVRVSPCFATFDADLLAGNKTPFHGYQTRTKTGK